LLKSNIQEARVEKFLEMLQNEIPIILSSLLSMDSQKELQETEVKIQTEKSPELKPES